VYLARPRLRLVVHLIGDQEGRGGEVGHEERAIAALDEGEPGEDGHRRAGAETLDGLVQRETVRGDAAGGNVAVELLSEQAGALDA